MRVFGKTSVAIALSVAGAISSMSALAMASETKLHEQTIEIVADASELVTVFVNADNDVVNIELTKDQLKNSAELESALADVPAEVREKVIKQLSNLSFDSHAFKIHADSDHDISTWVDSESEHVIVLKTGDDKHLNKVAKKLVKKFDAKDAKVIQFKTGKMLGAETIIRMLEHAELSVDDLDKIQQALDAKR